MNDEFCPKCGKWVDQLDERSGWCDPCNPSRAKRRCAKCDSFKPLAHFTKDGLRPSGRRTTCRECDTKRRRAHDQKKRQGTTPSTTTRLRKSEA